VLVSLDQAQLKGTIVPCGMEVGRVVFLLVLDFSSSGRALE